MTEFIDRHRYDADYHVAMYAVDDAGNRGNLSNIVVLRVPAPPTEPPTEGPSSTGAYIFHYLR